MLSPQEISEKVLVKAVFGGYVMSEVDDFIEKIAEDYAALYKENAILKSKIKVLVEKVEEYRSTEDAMRMALLTAQRMGEDILADANRKKTEALTNADNEVRARLANLEKQIAAEAMRLNAAEKETAKFIGISQAIIRKHSEFLSKIEKARRTIPQSAEAPAPPEPTREEQIADAASQIGTAMEKLTAGQQHVQQQMQEQPMQQQSAQQMQQQQMQQQQIQQQTAQQQPAQQQQIQQQPTQQLPVQQIQQQLQQQPVYDDEGEPTKQYQIDRDGGTPKPKFDFDDLKFGANFSNED